MQWALFRTGVNAVGATTIRGFYSTCTSKRQHMLAEVQQGMGCINTESKYLPLHRGS